MYDIPLEQQRQQQKQRNKQQQPNKDNSRMSHWNDWHHPLKAF